jgi:hypothetical protein
MLHGGTLLPLFKTMVLEHAECLYWPVSGALEPTETLSPTFAISSPFSNIRARL